MVCKVVYVCLVVGVVVICVGVVLCGVSGFISMGGCGSCKCGFVCLVVCKFDVFIWMVSFVF